MTVIASRAATGIALRSWWSRQSRALRFLLLATPVLLATWISYSVASAVGQHHHQFDLRLYFNAINYWQAGHDLYSYAQPDPVNLSLGFTYPPLAAVLMWPMAALPWVVVLPVSVLGIIGATAGCVFVVLRDRVRLGRGPLLALTGVATAAAFTLEPVRQTLSFGQINGYLALLVLVDLLVLGKRGSRWTGVGIGIATAIKLTPGIFILYLLVTGRWRAAITAIGAAAGVSLLSAVVTPGESWQYFTSLVWQTNRVGYLDTTLNQSVNGLLARMNSPYAPDHRAYFALVVLVLAIGAWRVRRSAAEGDELAGLSLAGLAGSLVSPVTWVHHIYWVVPALVVLVIRSRQTGLSILRSLRAGVAVTVWTGLDWTRSLVLLATAIPIWCIPTARLMGIKDSDYSFSGAELAFAGSVQLLWMLAALMLLPTGRATERSTGILGAPLLPARFGPALRARLRRLAEQV